MSRSTKVTVGWTGDDGEDFRVRCRVSFGTPQPHGPSSWVPGDGDDEVEVLSVTADEGGAAREDLVPVVEQDGEFLARAIEEAADREIAAREEYEERRAEERRDERHFGRD